ncbi:MAG: lipid-A-disaccharide synthase [Verrucomicrobiae bacterium]|nr:lipid-A-disaccharide synthase [Verrucomicrobiae bacterium]
MSRTIFLLAGEASGDTRGAELIHALRAKDPTLVFAGMGGPKMREAGMEILADVSNLAVVGILEVIKNYRFFKRLFRQLLDETRRRKPWAVVGIDYPGFNLRFLESVRHARGPAAAPRTVQYVSPQIWAWHESRKWKMACYIDLLLCIFPFEPDLYEETGLRAVFVGHPLANTPSFSSDSRDPKLLAFFPGSREREIRQHMPVLAAAETMLKQAQPGLKIACACNAGRSTQLIRSFAPDAILQSPSHLHQHAAAAVVCSGTATLEAALAGLPMCVIYRVAWPTYLMGRALLRVSHLGMPNVLAGREIVREFIQHQFTAEAITAEAQRLLHDKPARQQMENDYAEVRRQIGRLPAAENAALEILSLP